MPVPIVEPSPIAVSELAVSTRFSAGALFSSATMASTGRTAKRRRRKDMGPRGKKRLAVGVAEGQVGYFLMLAAALGRTAYRLGPADRSRGIPVLH